MSGMGYLALGFSAVWLLVAGYLVWLSHKQGLIQSRLDDLEGDSAVEEQPSTSA